MDFIYNDGGRDKYFKGTRVGDCVCRAISIATDMDYLEVYNLINDYAKKERKARCSKTNARSGVRKNTSRRILQDLGWKWIPTMEIGSGCKVHLSKDELPSGTIIVAVSKHLVCVKDGVINDTHNCSREGNRCVYGYFIKGGA